MYNLQLEYVSFGSRDVTFEEILPSNYHFQEIIPCIRRYTCTFSSNFQAFQEILTRPIPSHISVEVICENVTGLFYFIFIYFFFTYKGSTYKD